MIQQLITGKLRIILCYKWLGYWIWRLELKLIAIHVIKYAPCIVRTLNTDTDVVIHQTHTIYCSNPKYRRWCRYSSNMHYLLLNTGYRHWCCYSSNTRYLLIGYRHWCRYSSNMHYLLFEHWIQTLISVFIKHTLFSVWTLDTDTDVVIHQTHTIFCLNTGYRHWCRYSSNTHYLLIEHWIETLMLLFIKHTLLTIWTLNTDVDIGIYQTQAIYCWTLDMDVGMWYISTE